MNAIKKARVDKRKLHVPFLSTFNYFRSWPMSRSWGWLGRGRLMYSTCWPETMFWRQRKMNFENIFILPNVIGDRSRRRFGGIFIKFPKVTSARSSLMDSVHVWTVSMYGQCPWGPCMDIHKIVHAWTVPCTLLHITSPHPLWILAMKNPSSQRISFWS